MTRSATEATVLIVGGGPSGLSAALLLDQAGIDVLLLERRDFTSRFPRAHLLNVRTMEAFAQMGVAEDIYASSPPDDCWHRVCWYTSLGGPTALHGREIGRTHAWGGGPDWQRYGMASPCRFANLPQMRLDPLLWRHAAERCPGRIRAHQEVVGLKPDGDGVTATVLDRRSGERYQVRARYAIAADGGQACSQLLGIRLLGPRGIGREIVSLYVAMDLSRYADEQALLTWFISPAGQGGPSGGLQALGPDRWGRHSQEWSIAVRPGADVASSESAAVAHVREILGIADLQIVVKATTRWRYEGLVAERFRAGRVFLVGDAAHRHPPTGGLGLNTGVQDVHNLCWKLAAVLRGQAGERLLDTYEAERRPVAAYNVEHSLRNAGKHRRIAAAMGLGPGIGEEQGWREIATWASATSEGERRRAATDAAVAANAEDYSQLNVEAGFAYRRGALLADGTPPPPMHDSPIVFQPTARPGHHVPHVWLNDGRDRVSTVDLVADEGLTLFVSGAEGPAWGAAVAYAASRHRCPVTVVEVGPGTGLRDRSGEWTRVCGTAGDGAILVRPDRHVAWRAQHAPADRGHELVETLTAILERGVEEPSDADVTLAGIKQAAEELSG